MIRTRTQVIIWLALYALWVGVSAPFHPSVGLNFLVTALLLVAYAAVVYLNALLLWPRLWQRGRRVLYVVSLVLTMLVVTMKVMVPIRNAYARVVGPEHVGPYWPNFAIDLFGMAVHVASAAVVVWALRKRKNPPQNPTF